MSPIPQRPSGGLVLAGVALILTITAVLPPAGAWALNAHRVRQTTERAAAIASRLSERADALRAAALTEGLSVACGPGRVPDQGPTGQWVSRAVQTPALLGQDLPTDGWGRCFLVNIGAFGRGGSVWVMSAGPNGVIETYPDAAVLTADDIGARIR